MEQIKKLLSFGEMVALEPVKVALGALILFAGSQISIPLQPVPIVLSTISVMLIGLLYQRSTALMAVSIYIAAGAIGMPVFQGFSGGLAILSGPTAGYIFGFFLAVLVMTSLREQFNMESFFKTMLNCLLGTVAIFIPGVVWLSILIGFDNAIEFGVLPFILPGLVKAFLLCGAIKFIKPALSKKTHC